MRTAWIQGASKITCEFIDDKGRSIEANIKAKKTEVVCLALDGRIATTITVLDQLGTIQRSFNGRYTVYLGKGAKFITPTYAQLQSVELLNPPEKA